MTLKDNFIDKMSPKMLISIKNGDQGQNQGQIVLEGKKRIFRHFIGLYVQ